jgi:hypothetical protein
MGECKAGYYTDNSIVLRSMMVCIGGFGQPQCEFYFDCLKENKDKMKRKFKEAITRIPEGK